MDKLKAISVFVEVAEQGSFSAAARSMGVVNSVISKNILELEQWLGKKLIYRSTRRMHLTEAGAAYLGECREILERVRGLELHSARDAEALRGHVRVTAPVYLGENLLTPLVAEFRKLNPGVGVYLHFSDERVDLIQAGFDVALRVSQLPDSSLVSRRLRHMVLKLVASPDYVRKFGRPESLRELKQHECILEGEGGDHQRWRFRGDSGERVTQAVSGNVQANSGVAVKNLCKGGLGIAQLPGFLLDDELATGDLVELMPEHALDDFYVHLLYHKQAGATPGVAALIDFICHRC